jgi:hypothetical protein
MRSMMTILFLDQKSYLKLEPATNVSLFIEYCMYSRYNGNEQDYSAYNTS